MINWVEEEYKIISGKGFFKPLMSEKYSVFRS